MNCLKKQNRIIILGFLSIEFIIYISFLYTDLFFYEMSYISPYLKYSSIIICFAFALCRKYTNNILKIALFFTVVSDYMLLISDNYEAGIITFIIVQICYLYKLHDSNLRKTIRGICNNVGCALIVLFAYIAVGGIIEAVVAVAVFYFISIVRNVYISLSRAFGKEKNKTIMTFSIGMLLFLFCDINVGIFNLSGFITVKNTFFSVIYEFSQIGMWLFYLPSQVLIVMSD